MLGRGSKGGPDSATLVTGSTGFLGCLVTAALLHEERRRLVLPIRSMARAEDCLAAIRIGLQDRHVSEELQNELLQLASVVELPSLDRLRELSQVAMRLGVDEIVHCAGCVDYFDTERLNQSNIALTDGLLTIARSWNAQRFVFLSTAYCSGYRSDTIPECLHPDPRDADEPTEYTRSKRVAEWRVAESGVPFIIIRPSVVIGHSVSGVYRGKNYGLYQLWRAVEGLLCREYSPIWYHVAPPVRTNFVHADAFQAGFTSIYRNTIENAIVHLVSQHESCPTMRELCWMWANIYCPKEIHCFATIDDVPFHSLPPRHRRFLQVVAKNLEIASHSWKFENNKLTELRGTGLEFADATLESIGRCQRRYISESPRIQEHIRKYACRSDQTPRILEVEPLHAS
jgi:thioester reductase-like protein